MADGTGWMTWRDIAALWGAALSSLLFLERLFPARPLVRLEPGPYPSTSDPGLTVRIVNPSRDMLLVGNIRRFCVAGSATELGVYTRQTPMAEVGKNPSPVSLLCAWRKQCSALDQFCRSRRVDSAHLVAPNLASIALASALDLRLD
jgi:hypothetical protein